jgi:hypothetical protein
LSEKLNDGTPKAQLEKRGWVIFDKMSGGIVGGFLIVESVLIVIILSCYY